MDGTTIHFSKVDPINNTTWINRSVAAVLTDTGADYLVSELTLRIESDFNSTMTFTCGSDGVSKFINLRCKWILLVASKKIIITINQVYYLYSQCQQY